MKNNVDTLLHLLSVMLKEDNKLDLKFDRLLGTRYKYDVENDAVEVVVMCHVKGEK